MKVLNAKVAFKANIRKKANKLDNAHFREVMSGQTSALSAEDLAQEHAIMAAQDVSQMCVEGFIRPRCKVPTDLKYAIKDCRKVTLTPCHIINALLVLLACISSTLIQLVMVGAASSIRDAFEWLLAL